MSDTIKCGIMHGLGGQICCRDKGHEGYCRCKSERRTGGSVMYSEWESRDGKFYRHVRYESFYPSNAVQGDE